MMEEAMDASGIVGTTGEFKGVTGASITGATEDAVGVIAVMEGSTKGGV